MPAVCVHERACIGVLAVTVGAAGESIHGGWEGGFLGAGVEEGVALEGVEGVLALALHQRLQQEEEERSVTSGMPRTDTVQSPTYTLSHKDSHSKRRTRTQTKETYTQSVVPGHASPVKIKAVLHSAIQAVLQPAVHAGHPAFDAVPHSVVKARQPPTRRQAVPLASAQELTLLHIQKGPLRKGKERKAAGGLRERLGLPALRNSLSRRTKRRSSQP